MDVRVHLSEILILHNGLLQLLLILVISVKLDQLRVLILHYSHYLVHLILLQVNALCLTSIILL